MIFVPGPPAIVRLLLVSFAVIALVSCPWDFSTDFDDYDGVNLIEGQDFGASRANGGAWWFLTPGLTAETGGERSDGVTGVDFARFEPTSGTGPYAPPPDHGGAAVYRLEVVNLFRNGGFEGDDPLAGWTSVPAPPEVPDPDDDFSARADLVTTTPITGASSLRINFALNTTRYQVDLADTAVGLADGFVPDGRYAFHIDFRLNTEAFQLELHDGAGQGSTMEQWAIERGREDSTVAFSFPGTDRTERAASTNPNVIARDPSLPEATFFSFGGFNTAAQRVRIDGTFDNIRFVRADQAHYVRLPVVYRRENRPEISGGGTYTFSLWAKADPAVLDPDDPDFGNRFPARHLAAGLDRSPRDAAPEVIVDTERFDLRELNEDPGTWHQFTWEFSGHGIHPPFTADDDFVVFDIVLEVGDAISGPRYQDAGSVLLAAPSLTWIE